MESLETLKSVSGGLVDYRLGTLLSQFGLMEDHEIQRALKVANETGLPVGKVLVMFERISSQTLKAILDAQWMLKDELLTVQQAQHAVDLVRRNNWYFADALVTMGVDAYASRGIRLGELLVGSGQMIEDEIDEFLKVSNYSGLPLGRILLLLDRVHETNLNTTLKVQHDIRLGAIELDLGLNLLKESATTITSAPQDSSRLGDMLCQSGVVKESEIEIAASIAEANNKMIGEVLTEHGWIDEALLEKALSLQKKTRAGEITIRKAIESLKDQAQTGSFPPLGVASQLIGNEFERNISLYEYLRLTGYMTPAKLANIVSTAAKQKDLLLALELDPKIGMKEALKIAVTDSAKFFKLLVKTTPEDTEIVGSAHNLHQKVKQGSIKLDRSILEFALIKTNSSLAFEAV